MKGPQRFIVVGLIGAVGITSTLSGHPEIKHLLDKSGGTIPVGPVQTVSGTIGSSTSSTGPSFIPGNR